MDDIQLERRRKRAKEEGFRIRNTGGARIFSTYEVLSPSGRTYEVALRSLARRINGCTCPDFRVNMLGTCKHIEAVVAAAAKRVRGKIETAERKAPPTAEIFLAYGETIRVAATLPDSLRGPASDTLQKWFDAEGFLVGDPRTAFAALEDDLSRLPPEDAAAVRFSPEAREHARMIADAERQNTQRAWFLGEVAAGRRTLDVTGAKLYPYQQEGALHLAFTGRALLADDMGLGKTVQAIVAATLLRELRGIERVLVVTPASLKHQWLREIRRFTSLSAETVAGPAGKRELLYAKPAFFTIVNYELLLRDQAVFARLAPDLLILDEAQRVRNFRTKTAEAVKRIRSRYAFVLTGTPLENNLDDLYSILQTLDPRILGPLWRFNNRYFDLRKNKSGTYKVLGHKNLDELRERLRPVMLRRTREEVLADLPPRTDNHFFVEMSPEQREPYADFQRIVAQLLRAAERRPLTPREIKRMFQALQKMRVICDALELHDPRIPERLKRKTAPKLAELEGILREQVLEAGRKAVIFSSFEGMIDLAIARVARPLGIGHVKLAGSVPTERRGKLLDRFAADPDCRLFFSTDAGGVGLNLQSASLVIHLDIPWNPAVLEQRIGRAHRLGQKSNVHVIHLIARDAIEERMLETLDQKRRVFDAIFAGTDAPDELAFARDRGLVARLTKLLDGNDRTANEAPAETKTVRPPLAGTDAPDRGELPATQTESPSGTPREETARSEAPDRDASPDGAHTHPRAAERPPAAHQRIPGAVRLRDAAGRLAASLGPRLLLVQAIHAAPPAGDSPDRLDDHMPGLLVVVDRDGETLEPEIASALRAANDGRLPRPLLIFDRRSYRSMLTLAPPAGATDELFRSPAYPRTDHADNAERADRAASEALAKATERLKLARLMASGGFATETVVPLSKAFAHALHGLHLLGDPTPPNDPHDPRLVEKRLVATGILSAEDATRIPWLRAMLTAAASDEADPLDPALVARMADTLARLIEAGELARTRRAL